MKKGLTIIIGLFFSWGLLNAQNQAMERLNAYKVAFFTKRLNLTTRRHRDSGLSTMSCRT